MAILKNTNFFRAFTTSSMIPAIYIQQFWDTMCFNSSTGLYSCQLDEQWFNLHKDILRDALDITPPNDNNPFVAPPSSDVVIEYVNTLGYPSTLRNVSAMSVNDLYQPWRAILFMINMCLIGKMAGYNRQRHPVLQILWASRGKKKTAHLLIPNVRYVGKDGMETFGMPIPDAPLTDAIKSAPYYSSYLEHVTEYQHEGVPKKEPAHDDEEANLQRALDLKVQGNGKEKVVEEQATHDLLTLQTPKPKNPADKFIFQRCPPMPTGPFEHADSPSLDVKLALTDSE
ncbi:hypothetical protein Tco_0132678, partial [Tanacetum coccineum]